MLHTPLALASQSPRRHDLLRGAGIDFTVVGTTIDESAQRGESAVACARRLCQMKLEHARRDAPDSFDAHLWLAADTIVWVPPQGDPIGKPSDVNEARDILSRLTRPPSHCVTTAFAIARRQDTPVVEHETTHVHMRPLEKAELETFLAGNQWRDKAGGYAIQAEAAGWVTHIEGSYTNVVGLPLAQVLMTLHRWDKTP